MVFQAALGSPDRLELQPTEGEIRFNAPTRPSHAVTDDQAKTLNIWHWKTLKGFRHRLRDVTCISRGMDNRRFTVLNHLDFEAEIAPLNPGRTAKLPFTDAFLVRKYFLEEGRIKGGFLYPLEAEVDASLLYVFVYDFTEGLDRPKPIADNSVLDEENFMPDPGAVGTGSATAGQTCEVRVCGLRVMAFVSLVCCKERRDFFEGDVVGIGRFYPHMMIMANRSLKRVVGRVRYERPKVVTCEPPLLSLPADIDTNQHATTGGGFQHPGMRREIGTILLSDTNEARQIASIPVLPISPFWDDLFDNFEYEVKTDLVTVVRPDLGERTLPNAVKTFRGTPFLKAYVARDVRRVPRQGAFDNLHVAPRMRPVDASGTLVRPPGPPYHAEKVLMAPFCEHDCVHTHWRWGEFLKGPIAMGWSSDIVDRKVPGKPCSKPGAPLVPDNQTVQIRVENASTFEYQAVAEGKTLAERSGPIPAGTYTIINHHGSGYALFLDPTLVTELGAAVSAAILLKNEPVLVSAPKDNMALIYWHLRFSGSTTLIGPDEVHERLQYGDSNARRSLRDE